MKKNIFILFFAMIFIVHSFEVYAQKSPNRTKRVKSGSAKSKASSKARARGKVQKPSATQQPTTTRTKRTRTAKETDRSHFIFGPKVLLWQESIPATRGADSSELRTQFSGMALGVTFRKPTSNIRWMQSHSFDVAGGALVAKSAGTTFTDHLKNQMWYSVTARPGLGYRTTSNSELGFGVPLTFRKIDWQLKDPALKLERASSFSYGLSGTYVTQLSRSSSLLVEVTQHIPWSAFVWSIGWNYRFY